MTVSIDGTDLSTALQVASVVATIIGLLIGGLVLYLLVRPPRKNRRRARPEAEALDPEQVMQVLDRMEQRLEVLERAIGREPDEQRQLLNAGLESPEDRRVK
jgi:hypothetical protein